MRTEKNETKPMGEVRVKVKLTNFHDELRADEGRLKPSQIRRCTIEAVVDAGAVRSVIPQHVLKKIGVRPRGERLARYADGRTESVGLAEGIRFEIMDRDTTDDALVLGDEVPIGQTVLEKLDLLVDCANRQLVPNPKNPDQPVSMVR